MGIQINGKTNIISATDGALNVSGADLGSASASSLNISGIVTATTLSVTNIKHPSFGSNTFVLDSSGNINIDSGGVYYDAVNNRLAIGNTGAGSYNSGFNQLVVGSSGDQGITIVTGTSNSGTLAFADGTSGADAYRGYVQYQHGSTNALVFATGGSERFRCDSSGRLLVGTSSALAGNNTIHARVQVVGNSAASPAGGLIAIGRNEAATSITTGETLGTLVFGDSSAGEYAWITCEADGTAGSGDYPGRLVFSTTADGAASPTPRMQIDNAGRSYIFSSGNGLLSTVTAAAGTTTTLFSGNHSSAGGFTGGTASVYIWSNGNIQNTNNSYGAISDVKLKENIVDATSQWSDVKAFRVRKYNLKQGQTHTQIGVVANEIELISPGLVFESPDRDAEGNDLGTVTKSVNYSVLYMKAVKALQEAMERIEQLETEMAAVKAQLS